MATRSRPYPAAEEQYRLRRRRPRPEETAPRRPGVLDVDQKAQEERPSSSGIGISCSGGGIRSAAFCLGALQALTNRGWLQRAECLTAVSGGSYIAASYAMVARHSDPDLLAEHPPFEPGSPEEEFLRNNCSYLAAGAPGKARFLSSVVVGVLANVVFFGLLLYLLRPLGWLYGEWHPRLREGAGPAALGEVRTWAVVALAAVALGVGAALVARMFHPSWRTRRFLDRSGLVLVAAGSAVGMVGVVLPWLIVVVRELLGGANAVTPVPVAGEGTAVERGTSNLSTATTVGAALVGAGALAQVTSALRAAFDLGEQVTKKVRWFTGLNARVRTALLSVAGAVVAPLVLLGGALLVLNGGAAHAPGTREIVTYAVAVVLAMLLLRFADVTSWSMHPFYRRRLASAFAVKRTRIGDDTEGTVVAREIDYNAPLPLSDFNPAFMPVPFPEVVVCAAANVTDPSATPPGSAVTSFTFSPSVVGGPLLGGMSAVDYQNRVGSRRRRDVTLPAAVAMSGAAVSPAMGKMTKAPVRALLALANVRLGVWMPNPGRLDAKSGRWKLVADNPRPLYLLYEVLGRHKLTGKYVYVSDGGHYENLGLVELLRRRCATVVCLDAAGGSPTSFATLGEAVALARAELGVEITVDPTDIRPKTKQQGKHAPVAVVEGTILYPDQAEPGRLIYVKSAVTGDCPWDVLAYAEKDKRFPAHSTAEQLYTGERFEAYRVLGRTAGSAAAAMLDELFPQPAPADVPTG